jgi:hypothetical protein
MPISRSRYRRQYLESVSYLAFTEARANALSTTQRDGRHPRLVKRGEMEDQPDDALAPARGILNGLRISLTLWSFIALVILLTR